MKVPPLSSSKAPKEGRVGLVYDERMCKHSTPKGVPHPENPNRIRSIWNKLTSAGLHHRCKVFDAKEVEDKYVAAVHTSNHINLIKTVSSKKTASQRNKVAARYDSIYFNEGSSESAYLAVGSVLEVAEKVANGELNSAFAIVRPPGHHAEEGEPMGFCMFNNVAIATRFLLNKKELGINKILIVDWDVHHGNGTQKMFYKDSQVLFFSVHRHEYGRFYPTGNDGSHIMIGEGPGTGYNINVPWENGQCGDADYNVVWDHILIPVAREFNPDIIIISAGFDAAIGDPLGGCRITPHGYSIMLKKLMRFSRGKIIMALEGGYNLNSLANSVVACVEMLLEDKPIAESFDVYPFESTWRVIKAVRKELSAFWPILADKLPKELTSKVSPQLQIYSSQSEDEYDDVTLPLSKLNLSEDVDGAGFSLGVFNAPASKKRKHATGPSASYDPFIELSINEIAVQHDILVNQMRARYCKLHEDLKEQVVMVKSELDEHARVMKDMEARTSKAENEVKRIKKEAELNKKEAELSKKEAEVKISAMTIQLKVAEDELKVSEHDWKTNIVAAVLEARILMAHTAIQEGIKRPDWDIEKWQVEYEKRMGERVLLPEISDGEAIEPDVTEAAAIEASLPVDSVVSDATPTEDLVLDSLEQVK